MCNDVALGPGEGFMLHSDQNCPGIPALLDSRTGTAPVEGHTHTRTHACTHTHARTHARTHTQKHNLSRISDC